MTELEPQNRVSGGERTRLLVSLCLNLAVVLLEIYAFRLTIARNGAGIFQYYTEDSNLLALVVCALCAFYQGRALKTGAALPDWVRRAYYPSGYHLLPDDLNRQAVIGDLGHADHHDDERGHELQRARGARGDVDEVVGALTGAGRLLDPHLPSLLDLGL